MGNWVRSWREEAVLRVFDRERGKAGRDQLTLMLRLEGSPIAAGTVGAVGRSDSSSWPNADAPRLRSAPAKRVSPAAIKMTVRTSSPDEMRLASFFEGLDAFDEVCGLGQHCLTLAFSLERLGQCGNRGCMKGTFGLRV